MRDMEWYWSATQLPELAALPKRERMRIVRVCQTKPLHGRLPTLLFAFTFLILCIQLIGLLLIVLPNTMRHKDIVVPSCLFSVANLLFAVIGAFCIQNLISIPAMRPYIREMVSGLCLRCGY